MSRAALADRLLSIVRAAEGPMTPGKVEETYARGQCIPPSHAGSTARQAITQALDLLVDAGYLSRNGDVYRAK